jgi:hypothetical protein
MYWYNVPAIREITEINHEEEVAAIMVFLHCNFSGDIFGSVTLRG